MTDAELARMARRAATCAAKAAQWAGKAQTAKDAVREELERRDTKSITTGGYLITYVAPQTVEYDQQKLRRVLGRDLYQRCMETKVEFRKDALLSLVQEGEVSMDKVDRCTRVIDLTPYARITPTAEA